MSSNASHTGTMNAIRIGTYGGRDVLRVHAVPIVRPKHGEVTVRLAFAGINFIDVYMRNGTYRRSVTYQSELPLALGMEGAGTVEDIGPAVRGLRPGDRVTYCLVRGSYAEVVAVPAWKCVLVPAGLPLDRACAATLQGAAAHYLTHDVYPLVTGSTALVYAAAGGVGQLLVQFAKSRGARVLAVVGNRQKAAIVEALGADAVIVRSERDIVEAVHERTSGQGVNVAYDSIGMATMATTLRCICRRGTYVLYGASSGPVHSIDPLDLAEAGSLFFTRPHLADYLKDTEELQMRIGTVLRAVLDNRLHVAIDRVVTLGEVCEAHAYLERGETRGKILIQL